MKSSKSGRRIATILTTLFTVLLLSACGGSGGSSTGSGSFTAESASLAGNVSSGLAWNESGAESRSILISLIEFAITEAQAAGIGGVNVELLHNGVVIDSQTTTASGDFFFNGLQPGNYTVRLSQGGQQVGVSPVIQLDANTRTRLDMNLDGKLMEVEIEAEKGTISGEVEEEHGHDDDHDDYRDDDYDDDHDDDEEDEDDDRDEDDHDCDDEDDDCYVKRS